MCGVLGGYIARDGGGLLYWVQGGCWAASASWAEVIGERYRLWGLAGGSTWPVS